MAQFKVNLACGGVYVLGYACLDFDYANSELAVQAADMHSRLPIPANSAGLMY